MDGACRKAIQLICAPFADDWSPGYDGYASGKEKGAKKSCRSWQARHTKPWLRAHVVMCWNFVALLIAGSSFGSRRELGRELF